MVVAIDGYSSTGKSTIAKMLAKKLNFTHIDTGALYRGITLYALENCITDDYIDKNLLIQNLDAINLQLIHSNSRISLFLNNENVSSKIREPKIAQYVSEIAAIPEVRNFLLETQRAYAKKTSIVMDGRDIGTTVFPNADIKFFLTASIEERTRRRYTELKQAGKDISEEEVKANLIDRDYKDSHREISPLTQAEDAILIDNSKLNQEQTLQLMLDFCLKHHIQ